jgi:hypothetical protein
MSPASRVAVVALLLALAVGGFLWWRKQQVAPPPPAPLTQPVAPAPPPPAPPPAAPPPIRNPIEGAARSGRPLPALGEEDDYVKKALIDLLGRKGVLSFLFLDGFARRFVATVDNLGNERAPVQLWPVNPTPGRFQAEPRTDGMVISDRNAARYTPLVRFVTAVDTRRAVALYKRLYPLLQQAYEELGYPGKYFNDRVVDVVDELLATPDLAGTVKVKPLEVQQEGKTVRPPGLYQFEDPTLERRPAGQKILLRIGRQNAALLKAKLAEIRRQIGRAAPAR